MAGRARSGADRDAEDRHPPRDRGRVFSWGGRAPDGRILLGDDIGQLSLWSPGTPFEERRVVATLPSGKPILDLDVAADGSVALVAGGLGLGATEVHSWREGSGFRELDRFDDVRDLAQVVVRYAAPDRLVIAARNPVPGCRAALRFARIVDYRAGGVVSIPAPPNRVATAVGLDALGRLSVGAIDSSALTATVGSVRAGFQQIRTIGSRRPELYVLDGAAWSLVELLGTGALFDVGALGELTLVAAGTYAPAVLNGPILQRAGPDLVCAPGEIENSAAVSLLPLSANDLIVMSTRSVVPHTEPCPRMWPTNVNRVRVLP